MIRIRVFAVLSMLLMSPALAKRDKVAKISPLNHRSKAKSKMTSSKAAKKMSKGSLNANDIKSYGLSKITEINAQFFQDDEQEVIFRWKDSSSFGFKKSDDLHWYGEVDNGVGAMNLIQSYDPSNDGKMTGLYGSASFGGNVYSIMVAVNGSVAVEAMSSSEIPMDDPDEDDAATSPDARTLSLRGSQEQARNLGDDGSVIDIMCVYTPKTVCYQANKAGFNVLVSDSCDTLTYKYLMDAKCQLAIAESNTAYTQSGVNTRLNLIYVGILDPTYVEYATWGENSNSIINMKSLSQLRDTYAADLVAVILNNGQYGGSSGVGGTFFVNQNYMTGYYSLSHEIGHNLGCRHDKGYYQAGTPSGSNYGYVDKVTGFRTIMAVDFSVPRLQYFSNPDPTYSYKNVSIGSSSDANCVAQMNSRVNNVANYRQSSTRIGNPVPSPKPVMPTAKPTKKPSSKALSGTTPVSFATNKPTSTPKALPICSVNTGVSCSQSQVSFVLKLDRPKDLNWSIINPTTNEIYCKGGRYSSSSIPPLSFCLRIGQSLKLQLNDQGNVGFFSSSSTYNATVGVIGSTNYNYFTKNNAMQKLKRWRGHLFQT